MRAPGLLLALAFVAGCATADVPRPGERELARARRDDPLVTLDVLAHGRERFVNRCSGCHSLPDPRRTPRDEWPDVLDKMALKAKLAQEDRRAVLLYLRSVTAS